MWKIYVRNWKHHNTEHKTHKGGKEMTYGDLICAIIILVFGIIMLITGIIVRENGLFPLILGIAMVLIPTIPLVTEFNPELKTEVEAKINGFFESIEDFRDTPLP